MLNRAAILNLPNWYLAAGALSQTIWNKLSSLPPDTGISDYDLVYFDDSNLSYEHATIHSGLQMEDPLDLGDLLVQSRYCR